MSQRAADAVVSSFCRGKWGDSELISLRSSFCCGITWRFEYIVREVKRQRAVRAASQYEKKLRSGVEVEHCTRKHCCTGKKILGAHGFIGIMRAVLIRNEEHRERNALKTEGLCVVAGA